MADNNIWICLDKHGRLLEARIGDEVRKPVALKKKGDIKPGDKDVLPDCEQILGVLILQLISCYGKGSEPCWFVNPATGEGIWIC